MITPLAVVQGVTGLAPNEARWLLDGVALVLPWLLLAAVDYLARRIP